MKSRIVTFYILLNSSSLVFGQQFSFLGARSAGIANASTALADDYSLFNNPGALGYVDEESISAGYMNYYGIEGLNSVLASFTKSVLSGKASIGVLSFGDEIYKNDKLTLAFGNNFGIAGLGASISYHQMYIEGFGSGQFISMDLGGLAELTPTISVGGCIKNITQSRVSKYTGEYYPTLMTVSLILEPSNQLSFYSQYDKDLQHPGLLKFAMEYVYSALILRIGLITEPSLMHFGLGFHHKKIRIDYALRSHPSLNSSHFFSISYHFNNDKNAS